MSAQRYPPRIRDEWRDFAEAMEPDQGATSEDDEHQAIEARLIDLEAEIAGHEKAIDRCEEEIDRLRRRQMEIEDSWARAAGTDHDECAPTPAQRQVLAVMAERKPRTWDEWVFFNRRYQQAAARLDTDLRVVADDRVPVGAICFPASADNVEKGGTA